MRCAYSSITCPAGNDAPGHRGGDIVAAVETRAAVRLLVGDVMGHGPEATGIASSVTDAFTRLAAHAEDPPQVVAARLDRVVADAGVREGRGEREEFVTAQFIDIPRDSAARARIVCCGHPPPLVIWDGGAAFLDAIPPAPPLGLLDLAGPAFPCPVPLVASPGDTVLFYTDGVTDARDDRGAPYPLPRRAAAIAREGGTGNRQRSLVRTLAADLLAHVGSPLRDDATLMTLQLGDTALAGPRKRPRSIFLAAELAPRDLAAAPLPRARVHGENRQQDSGNQATPGGFAMLTALEIAREATLKPISEIAADIGIPPWLTEHHGDHVAKIDLKAIEELKDRPKAKYVVVTAITPTPLGEGKTTTTIGLGQAFSHIGRKATISIRQASMGPTFGIKGGAAGGGYSQAVPFETLNLHLTGDMHAVTAAHNQLSAMVDNHLYKGIDPRLDLNQITWRHVMDVNDRSLRNIVAGLGAAGDGVPRQTGFDITAASEAMAILALASSLKDMRQRLGRIVVGYTRQGDPVTAEQLRAAGAMAVIMKDALKPNLLQTLENTPVIVHAGPFGNIAHGNSSVVGDLIGIHTGDFLVTEAGFGADMGAERFFNIKCRVSGLKPDAAVVVATVRALKSHSGKYKVVAGRPLPEEMLTENPDDVFAGADNLRRHLDIVRAHGVEPVVAVNAMPSDYPSEHAAIREVAAAMGVRTAVSTHFADGGRGAAELAEAVEETSSIPNGFSCLYPLTASLKEKVEAVASRIYGADGVDYTPLAEKQLASYERNGFGNLPVCIAKTQYSLSHDGTLKGAPTGFRLPVREVRASVGAGFVYPICGDMRTMPGLAAHPAAESIDLDDDGNVVGLY